MISIIIPTYNEENVIVDCLNSLTKQSYKEFEVIVIDDGSTDKTVEYLKQLQIANYELKLIFGTHEGAGSARNLGVKSARGKVLVFVDADMTFEKNFLKMLAKPILAGKSKGTFSKDEYVSNWNKSLSRAYNLNEGWENKKRHQKKYPDTQKVFRAILKSEFDKVGGFTAGGYNDDWSLSEKLGYEATLAPKAIFYHKNPDNLFEIFTHARWVGKRNYKLGLLGYIVALIRCSLPVSLIVGLSKAFLSGQPTFLIFKIVYDLGLFIGIIDFIVTKKGAK